MDGASGQTGGKNRTNTFVLTAFISFGMFNVFQLFPCNMMSAINYTRTLGEIANRQLAKQELSE
jgi:succinate-acetate transporter protein